MVKIYVKLVNDNTIYNIEAELGDTVKDAIEYELNPDDW